MLGFSTTPGNHRPRREEINSWRQLSSDSVRRLMCCLFRLQRVIDQVCHAEPISFPPTHHSSCLFASSPLTHRLQLQPANTACTTPSLFTVKRLQRDTSKPTCFLSPQIQSFINIYVNLTLSSDIVFSSVWVGQNLLFDEPRVITLMHTHHKHTGCFSIPHLCILVSFPSFL